MQTNSSHQSNPSISKIYITDNCDCMCHYPDDIEINEENSFFQNNPPSNQQSQKYIQSKLKQKLFRKKNCENLCVCDKPYVYVVHVLKKDRVIIIKIYILK